MKICYSCFKEYKEYGSVCPYCGCICSETPKEPIHLSPGTVLGGRYIVGQAIGSGGFGIVYKAFDTKFETVVAIKEFFISRICTRAGGLKNLIINKKSFTEFSYRKDRFLAEARNMAKFGNHRSIPNVFEYFEENNTAYIVMELLVGMTLSDYMAQNGGKFDVDFAIHITNEVGIALKSLHEQKIIHRDVAPDNIFICTDKDVHIKLMDLGAAKLEDSTDNIIDIILKPGYSPPEQYDKIQNIGAWSDIYALASTLYLMLTGIKPLESTNRKVSDDLIQVSEINSSVSENLNNTIMKAMAIEPHMRFQTVDEFLKALSGGKKVLSLKTERKKRKRKRLVGIVAAFVALTIGFGVVTNNFINKKNKEILEEATVNIWLPVEKDDKYADNVNNSQQNLWQHFSESFCSIKENQKVKMKIVWIPEEEYENKLITDLKSNNSDSPTIFFSSDLSDNIVSDYAMNLKNIVLSNEFIGCEILNENYNSIYPDKLQLPLSVNCPMAIIQSNNQTDFEQGSSFSCYEDLLYYGEPFLDIKNSFLFQDYVGQNKISFSDFANLEYEGCSILLTGTDSFGKYLSLKNHSNKAIKVVLPNNDINCSFSFELSINKNISKSQINAAEKFLRNLLTEDYQKMLCIRSRIPVCESAIDRTSFGEDKDIYLRMRVE